MIHTNLTLCFPDMERSERRQLARASLAQIGRLVFDLAQIRFWSIERLLEDVEIEGEASLKSAFESDRGLLLLVPHFGNWELLCAYLGVHYSVAALYDPPKIKSLEPIMIACRENYQGTMYPIDVGGMRGILKELKAGRLVAVLPDQVPSRDAGEYADFYGHPALTMTLPKQLVDRTDAAVLMGSVQRIKTADGRYGHRLTFEPLPETGDEVSFERKINLAVESVIARAPEQYQWSYKRFKRPPTVGPTNVYRRQ